MPGSVWKWYTSGAEQGSVDVGLLLLLTAGGHLVYVQWRSFHHFLIDDLKTQAGTVERLAAPLVCV